MGSSAHSNVQFEWNTVRARTNLNCYQFVTCCGLTNLPVAVWKDNRRQTGWVTRILSVRSMCRYFRIDYRISKPCPCAWGALWKVKAKVCTIFRVIIHWSSVGLRTSCWSDSKGPGTLVTAPCAKRDVLWNLPLATVIRLKVDNGPTGLNPVDLSTFHVKFTLLQR